MDGEELEELCIEGNLGVSGIFVDAVEEVGLFVVVGGKDDIVDDSLQDLRELANTKYMDASDVRNEASRDLPPQPLCQEPVCNACKHQDTCHRVGPG